METVKPFLLLSFRYIAIGIAFAFAHSATADNATADAAFRGGDFAKALAEYRSVAEDQSAKAGFRGYAQARISLLYQMKWDGQDIAQAAVWAERAYQSGNPDGMVQWGRSLLYGWGGVPKNVTKASQVFEQASALGNTTAKRELADLYFSGSEVPKNETRGASLLREAVDGQDSEAMIELATRLYHGKGLPKNISKSRALYEKALEMGNPGAYRPLGVLYELGDELVGTKPDHKKSVEMYLKALEFGFSDNDGFVEWRLGEMYRDGLGVDLNKSEACNWFLKGATHGHDWAQFDVGKCYLTGDGIKEDEKAARTWLEKSAEAGNLYAQTIICNHFVGGFRVGTLPAKYVEWCEAAVAAGNASAMSNYANRLENGVGVIEDVKRAVALYQKAAEKGDTWAHYRLGFYYGAGTVLPLDAGKSCKHYQEGAKDYRGAQEGLATCYDDGAPGFPKDIKKAISYYEQATSGKYSANFSHYRLGYLYYFGAGTERNTRLAAKYLIRGATQKPGRLPRAGFYILGLMYEEGDGVPKNDGDAFSNYMKGAEAGHLGSQNKVGAKYAEGKGVAKDINRALMWFTIAAANGFKDAAENRDKAEKLLKPMEISRAQKLAKEWLEKHPSD